MREIEEEQTDLAEIFLPNCLRYDFEQQLLSNNSETNQLWWQLYVMEVGVFVTSMQKYMFSQM